MGKLFGERELSKKDFERIDIDVRSMPKEIKEKLLNGELTPLVEIRDQLDNGIIVTMPVKLRLQRDTDGNAVLKAYPVSKDIVSDLKLQDAEQKRLQAGEVIQKDIREGNRTRTMFLQLDQETKSLLKREVNKAEIDKRIDELEHVKDITLGQNQRQAIREGKPVELEIGDTKVTVGVDLRQNSGFKAIDGDMSEWKRQQEIKWDMANPGQMGYWQTDENRWEYKQVQEKYKMSEAKKETKEKTVKEDVRQTIRFK
jgi:hypothetical protein